MIKTKKGLRQRNKLTGLADTEPSVSADFNRALVIFAKT